MTMKLQNKSERTFYIGDDQSLRPGEVGELPKEYAKNLMAMYPDELIDLDAKTKVIDVKKIEASKTDEKATQ